MATHYPEIPLHGLHCLKDLQYSFESNATSLKNESDIVIVLCEEVIVGDGKFKLPNSLTAVDTGSHNAVSEQIALDKFTGKEGECAMTRVQHATHPFAAVVGLGNPSLGNATKGPTVAKAIVTLMNQIKAKTAVLEVPKCIQAKYMHPIFEHMFLELSPDNRFRTADRKRKISSLKNLIIYSDSDIESIKTTFGNAIKTAQGVKFAQEIVGAPGNYCHPPSLAEAALSMAKSNGLTAKILEQDECEKLGMGSYLAVNKGSMYPPKFIHLTYTPSGPVKKRIAYIGKGVSFDSGGYNLKVNAMIELMKFDCGGAAAVLGAAKSIGLLKPTGVEVHFIVAAAENMISHEAYRPGDILTASNGKTIEVGNTDAEGRLTLADALVYAEKLKVDEIVDIATLTGACMVGLGVKCGGVWSTDQNFAETLKGCGQTTGELLWPMPLMQDYKKEMLTESKYADLNNLGSRFGGAIVAALFLKEFVEKTTWAHIDIAGPCWDHKEGVATGFGTRTLTEYAVSKSSV